MYVCNSFSSPLVECPGELQDSCNGTELPPSVLQVRGEPALVVEVQGRCCPSPQPAHQIYVNIMLMLYGCAAIISALTVVYKG